MSVKHPVSARLGSAPEDYERLGISSDAIAPREDGMRTDGSKGTFEWWYFDAHLSDGSSLVVSFNTKEVTDAGHPLAPYANVTLDRPDGTHVDTNTAVFTEDFMASTDGCDVRMGPNRFAGDLHTYHIHVETGEITVDVPSPGTFRRGGRGLATFSSKRTGIGTSLGFPVSPRATSKRRSRCAGKRSISSASGITITTGATARCCR